MSDKLLAHNLTDSVSRETIEKLKIYESLLKDWQSRMNLISRNTLDDAWSRHFIDSLQLLPFIPDSVRQITDIGSGAGFPGLVIAAARPMIHVKLVESTGKKCAFLSAVAENLGLKNVSIMNERVEAVVSRESPPDMVTARALASLNELLTMIHPWTKKNRGLMALFPKGQKAGEEIDAAKASGWRFDLSSTPSLTEPSAKILTIKSISKA
jgi:16S rRNA (guanine527-N7)-methyltransferase